MNMLTSIGQKNPLDVNAKTVKVALLLLFLNFARKWLKWLKFVLIWHCKLKIMTSQDCKL